jgi:NAD+ kinase
MPRSFSTVGLIGRHSSPQIVDSLLAVSQCLDGHGVETLIEEDTASMFANSRHSHVSRQELGSRCDLIVVVGGDGSLLGVGRDLAHSGVPVLGVNRGGLGFLADIAPEQIAAKLSDVLGGAYVIEDHFLLSASIIRGDEELGRSPALNDVVVHMGGMARMMEFSLWVDDQFVYEQRSDGLIIASPTGSTAYALSAGGPILHPSLEAIVVVPMFPHTLTSRPLMVPSSSEIRIVATEDAEITCDSQVDFMLNSGDEVRISKYASPLRLVYNLGHSFYESCRSKLDWASRLGEASSSKGDLQ